MCDKYEIRIGNILALFWNTNNESENLHFADGDLRMKKSLFALAALGAFAGTAQAQSSVTIYGNLDATEVYQTAGNGKSLALTAAANTTSLWGLTGSEDMGSGLKMGFDLKSEINLATGATGSTTNVPPTTTILVTSATGSSATSPTQVGGVSNLFNRGANLFMTSASFGEVKVGRMDDIEWAMSGQFSTSNSNSFGSNQSHAQVGNLNNTGLGICGAKGVNGNGVCSTMGYVASNYSYSGSSDAFMAGIQYTSPNFNGVTVKVQNGLGANDQTINMWAGNSQAVGIFYNGLGGALNLAAAQSRKSDETGALGLTLTSFGAKYKVTNPITLTGIWTQTGLSNQTAAPGVIGTSGANAGNTSWSLGVNYQVTPAADISVAYTSVTGDTSPTANGTGTNTSVNGTANSVTMWGLTGRYNFSKRTQMYAGAGQSSNTGAYFMSPIYGGTTMTAVSATDTRGSGGSITAYMLGLRHTF